MLRRRGQGFAVEDVSIRSMTGAAACVFPRASEMRRRRSWNRPSAQEPGAAVRIPRLAWWTDHPSVNAGPGCGEAEVRGRPEVGELTKQAPWQVRTRPSRALLRPVPG